MAIEIMIDLETLGTEPTAVVASIGAIAFDIDNNMILDKFSANLEIQPQLDAGRTISASTIEWWMKQDHQARAVFNERKDENGVKNFVNWVKAQKKEGEDLYIWGNGPSFDVPIVQSLIKSQGLEVPWPYYNVNCLRTFRRFMGNNEKVKSMVGVKHNAVDDAENQALYILNKMHNKDVKPARPIKQAKSDTSTATSGEALLATMVQAFQGTPLENIFIRGEKDAISNKTTLTFSCDKFEGISDAERKDWVRGILMYRSDSSVLNLFDSSDVIFTT